MEQLFLLGLALDQTRRLALAQQNQRAIDQIEHFLGKLGVFAGAFGLFLQLVDALFQAVEIGQHQFGLDGLDVGDRIDLVLDMGNVVVLETAHHMHDGVHLADGGEELVAEPLAFGGAAHQAGDVHEGDAGRDDLFRLRQRAELFQARIRHRDLADIRLDGAERIIRRLRRRRLRERIKERRLADIRQADDAAFESHEIVRVL